MGKADEKMKLKISRREAKETFKWLDLTLTYDDKFLEQLKLQLIDDGEQTRKILLAIIINWLDRKLVSCFLSCPLYLFFHNFAF